MNMEETNKSPNDHGENKKMVIKLGGGGGGSGIGAVVLLGGALATAALASVFAVRQKRRSSGEDSHNSSPEINNKNEDGEADISEGGKEDVELKLDDKAMVETDGTISDDGFVIKKEIPLLAENLTTEDEEEKVEFTKEDVSDDYLHDDQIEADKNVDVEKKGLEGFCNGSGEINEEKCVKLKATKKDKVDLCEAIIVSERISIEGEKTLLPLFEGHEYEKDRVEFTNEDVSDDYLHDQVEADKNVEVEKKELEGFCDGNGEINEEKCAELNDNMDLSEAIIVSEQISKGGEKTLLPLFEGQENEKDRVDFTKEDVSDDYLQDQFEADKNVEVEKKELEGFCNGNGEISEEKCVELKDKADLSEAIIVFERISKDEAKTMPPLSEGHGYDIEQDNVDGDDEEGSLPTDDAEMVQVDEAIVEEDEKCYVSDAGIVPKQNRLVDDMGEVGESKTSMQFDAEKNVKEMEEEVIPVEVARDGDNGEDPQKVGPDGNWTLFSHPDDRKDDVEKEDEKGELMREKRLEQFFSDGSRGKDLNDEAALSNGSCSESNWEALWQAEMPQQVKIMKYEVGGKIQEDILNSESYAMELRRIKGYPTNYSMRWRVIIWTVSVLSSLSCSWFFDLSIAKVSLVVFLTAFLLEIYGYSLLNRQHAQCLLAAEEDHAYDHKMPSKKLAKI